MSGKRAGAKKPPLWTAFFVPVAKIRPRLGKSVYTCDYHIMGAYAMNPVFTKEQIRIALDMRGIEIIYSYGAFKLYGLAFRVNERAFRFDPEADPEECLMSYLGSHPEAEVIGKICEALNGGKFLSDEDKEYCAKELDYYRYLAALKDDRSP